MLDLLRRRGKHHPEDFARLQLAEPFDLVAAKATWLAALDAAERASLHAVSAVVATSSWTAERVGSHHSLPAAAGYGARP